MILRILVIIANGDFQYFALAFGTNPVLIAFYFKFTYRDEFKSEIAQTEINKLFFK